METPSHQLEQAASVLLKNLGPHAVMMGSDIPSRCLQDMSNLPPARPWLFVRPSGAAEVADVIRVALTHGIPVVPQGGLTGLCGGALPDVGAIALSTERLTGVEEIDPAAATMIVGAGTPLETVQKAADDAGLFYPVDLGSRGSCTIGGNIATNAGGVRVIRYGMTRDMVLGLEAVLPDGSIMTSLNKMLKNNAGYDLKQMLIGSEGTLGVVTRAVLRLFPKPACTMLALCAVDDYRQAIKLLAAARSGLEPLLSAFEVMWPGYWAMATQRVAGLRDPFAGSHSSGSHAAYILIEAQGSDAVADPERFGSWLERQAEAGLLADGVVAQSVADSRAFWAIRDANSEFASHCGPCVDFDIGLAVGVMDD
ncbi:FAD-binding oxidoreductase, partial [Microvirga pudoricolor]|uniref:FAD-binding oxidoreductase n=1 Tax=Microvirga pudoricolor TaxID=2778729 RepID=UPI00194EEA4B